MSPHQREGNSTSVTVDIVTKDDELATLTAAIREFARARDWTQFHTPRNLAMALGGEAGELLAELQWLSDAEIDSQLADGDLRDRLAGEIADVLIYLLRLSDVTGIDAVSAARAKISRNEQRYPVEQSRGNALKYTELARDGQTPHH